jgi:hypothetical protein
MSSWPLQLSRDEIGIPRSIAVDEQRGLVAVGSRDDGLSWTDAGEPVRGPRQHWIRVYERDTLRSLRLVNSALPVNSLAFHPTQPLLAAGTGSYDGGMIFYGELLLIHLDSGSVVSALGESREVRTVVWRSWRHGRVLDLGLAPYTDDELRMEAHTVGFDAVVERADWLSVAPGSIEERELDGPMRENARTETEETAMEAVQRWFAAVEGRLQT